MRIAVAILAATSLAGCAAIPDILLGRRPEPVSPRSRPPVFTIIEHPVPGVRSHHPVPLILIQDPANGPVRLWILFPPQGIPCPRPGGPLAPCALVQSVRAAGAVPAVAGKRRQAPES
jgi:hypothetical protein